MAKGIGFGKVILFGEHFVVYGKPSIVSAINSSTICEVQKLEKMSLAMFSKYNEGIPNVEYFEGTGWLLQDFRNATKRYKEEKFEEQKESIRLMLKKMNIDANKTPIKITFSGDLIAVSGVGASASSCASFVRAMNQEFNLKMDDNQINEVAFEGEKGYHGTPSGVDNTAAVFGGLLWFIKGDKEKNIPNKIELMKIKNKVEIVMADTGLVTDTKKAVEGVKNRMKAEKEKYDKIFEEYDELSFNARKSFAEFDLKKIGDLMNKNHELLQKIEVSCKELDELVDIAKTNGSYGAKLTGSGLGGYMVALTPTKELQEKVANELEKKSKLVIKTTIG